MKEKKLKDYFYANKKILLLLVLGNITVAISMVVWSFFMKTLADVGMKSNTNQMIKLAIVGSVFLIFYFMVNRYAYYVRRIFLRKVNYSLKDDIFKSILSEDINSFNSSNSARYISILNNDIKKIQNQYFMNIPDIIDNGITCVVAVIALFVYSPLVAIVTISVSLLPMIVPKLYGDKISDKQNKVLDTLEIYNSKIKDIFSGFEVIKSFNVDKEIKGLHSDIAGEVEDSLVDYRKAQNEASVLQRTISYFTGIIQLTFTVYLVIKGNITFGILLGTMQISNYVSNPLSHMSSSLIELKSVKHVKAKIENILNNREDMNNKDMSLKELNSATPIKFENLNYGYDHNLVLKDINFNFEKGKKYALVGNSGSGKSTLIKLIMGYFQEFSGNIIVGNQDIEIIDKMSLNENFSMIHQKSVMFNDTLKNNITMFKSYPDAKIQAAVKDAGLENVVNNLSMGLDSQVNESGNNYSGGEQQRISIARAFLRESSVMLLDEATSSLDNKTSLQIEDLVLSKDNLTAIVVTHKLVENVLKRYDCIIALNNGKIEEYGSFEELIDSRGYFYSLYKINS